MSYERFEVVAHADGHSVVELVPIRFTRDENENRRVAEMRRQVVCRYSGPDSEKHARALVKSMSQKLAN